MNTVWVSVLIGLVVVLDLASGLWWKNDDFPSNNPLKNFSPNKKGFFNYGSLTAARDPTGGNRNVIKVFYKKGTYSKIRGLKGAQFYSSPFSPQTHMKLSYEVYFSPGFQFVKGGKLPGLSGGNPAQCSGGRYADTCLSGRLMWRAGGYGEIYGYAPTKSKAFCARKDVKCSKSGKGISLGRKSFRLQAGKWNKITEEIKLNTVGKNDGWAKLYYNDQLKYYGKGIVWRTRNDIKLNAIFFSTFFGGADKSWAAKSDCSTYYRNFVLSN